MSKVYNMKVVHIRIKGVSVNKFLPKDNTIEMTVNFDDGQSKEIIKSVTMGENNVLGDDIVEEIKKIVRNANQEFSEDGLFDSVVNIVIEKEEESVEKMNRFFKDLYSKIQDVNHSKVADGYINLLNNVLRMKLELVKEQTKKENGKIT